MNTVVVIGGGIAGASVAAELARDHRVHLVEAEPDLAAHTTGRSAAIFSLEYGPPVCQKLTRDSLPLLPPGVLSPLGALVTGWDQDGAQRIRTALEHSTGHFEEVTATRAQALCPQLDADQLTAAVYEPGAARIDVMALHGNYLSILRQNRGIVHRNARVIELSRITTGWQVSSSDRRQWHADIVVNAAGAWGDHVLRLAGLAPAGLRPLRRSVAIARPQHGLLPTAPIVVDVANRWYFKPDSGAVLLSPQDESPHPAGDPRPDHEELARAIDDVNAVTSLGMRSVSTTWAGLRTFGPDGAPIVGPHPDEPSMQLLLGQGGFGIQAAPALAALCGAAVRGKGSAELDEKQY